MKVWQKVLSLILCLLMVAMTFASCGLLDPEILDIGTEDPEDPGTEEMIEIYVHTAEQLLLVLQTINDDPVGDSSKGIKYILTEDLDLNPGFSAMPENRGEEYFAPAKPTVVWEGIDHFCGVFEGNGHTISGLYFSNENAEIGDNIAFIKDLNGGTIRNLTIDNSYFYAKSEEDNAYINVAGLVANVSGEGATIENVTVNASVVSATDTSMNFGGVIGAVTGIGFTMKNVTFGGRVWAIGADGSIPSSSTSVTISQFIGLSDGGDIVMSGCRANGRMVYPAEGTTADALCAAYNNNATIKNTEFEINDPGEEVLGDTVKVYSALGLIDLLNRAKNGETFKGRTVKLMKDINLNEGYDGTLASATLFVEGFPKFEGTFDGNYHTLSGICIRANVSDGTTVGFFRELSGTVKNLKIENSLVLAEAETAVSNVKIGGIAAETSGTAKIVNAYIDVDVWTAGEIGGAMGGILGVNKENGTVEISNVIFAGKLGNASAGKLPGEEETPFAPTANELKVAGILADNKNATANSAKLSECLILSEEESFVDSAAAKVTFGKLCTAENTKKTLCFEEMQEEIPADSNWKIVEGYGALPLELAFMLSEEGFQTDTSWYDENAKYLYIHTVEELLGLAQLSQSGKTFTGQTIYLMSDIELNPGWDGNSIVTGGRLIQPDEAKVKWQGIKTFDGVFEGNGHTISGIYQPVSFSDGAGCYGGFINILTGTVKNLIVENSTEVVTPTSAFGTANMKIGGFIGVTRGTATLENLYVDLDTWVIFAHHFSAGGLIGSNDSGNLTVKNVVYAGDLGYTNDTMVVPTSTKSGNIYLGGILGRETFNESENTLNDCVMLGTLYPAEKTTTTTCVYAGVSNNGGSCNKTLLLEHCLNIETLLENIGAINESVLNQKIQDCYVGTWMDTDKTYAEAGWVYVASMNTVMPESVAKLIGKEYVSTTEEDHTTVRETQTTGGTSAEITPDFTWYNPTDTEFEISTAAQLLGLAKLGSDLVQKTDATTGEVTWSYRTFEGQTFKLTADIDLNEGWSANVFVVDGVITIPSAPANSWTPIKNFYGVFDGQGHTVKGVYVSISSSATAQANYGMFNELNGETASIKNLILKNGLVMSEQRGKIGGLVGMQRNGSVIENIYSEMSVLQLHWSSGFVSGIVAFQSNSVFHEGDVNVIRNVVYAGLVTSVTPDYKVPTTSPDMHTSQILGCSDHAELTNCLAAGMSNWFIKSAIGENDTTGGYGPIYQCMIKGTEVTLINCHFRLISKEELAAGGYEGMTYYEELGYAIPSAVYTLLTGNPVVPPAGPTLPDVINVYTAQQFMDLVKLAEAGETFKDKTIKFMADIDLDETFGGRFDTSAGDMAFLIPASENAFAGIPEFAGTLDGNFYTLSGFCCTAEVGRNGAIGFINLLTGTVKNLVIKSSAVWATATSAKNVKVGGIAAVTKDGAVIENVCADISVWAIGDIDGYIGGIVGYNEDDELTIRNVIFEGVVGTADKPEEETPDETFIPNSGFATPYVGGILGYNKDSISPSDLRNCIVISWEESFFINSDTESYFDAVTPSEDVIKNFCFGEYQSNIPAGSDWVKTTVYGAVPKTFKNLFVKETYTASTAWYNENAKYLYISTPADLLGLVDLSKSGKTFSGQTIYLMNDIDLNPGWHGNTAVAGDGSIIFPTEPLNVWNGLGTFDGVLDGNGHKISGIYQTVSFDGGAGSYGGFIEILTGTVKNLIVENGSILITPTKSYGTANMMIGGFIGVTRGDATLENLYIDLDVWVKFAHHFSLGGVIGSNNSGNLKVKDVVYAGDVGYTNDTMMTPASTASGNIYMGGILARELYYKEAEGVLENCVMLGILYPAGRAEGKTCVYDNISNVGNAGNKTLTLLNCLSLSGLTAGEGMLKAHPMTTENSGKYEADVTYAEAGWAFVKELNVILPGPVAKLLAGEYESVTEKDTVTRRETVTTGGTSAAITPDTTWYNETDTEFTLTTAAELLGFNQLAALGNDFEGKTIKLGSDIDLNDGWLAKTPVRDGKVTIPSSPANVWKSIPSFKGVFDGQGHTVKGIYVYESDAKSGENYGIFGELVGGEAAIRNLVLKNGLVRGGKNNVNNVRVGGIVGLQADGATIENIYSEMNVLYTSYTWGTVAGIVACQSNADETGANVIRNVVFAGMVTSANGTTLPSSSPSQRTAQIVGQTYICVMENCLAAGTANWYVIGIYDGTAGYAPLYQAESKDAGTSVKLTDCHFRRLSESEMPTTETYDVETETSTPNWTYNEELGYAIPTAVNAMLTAE